jgi:hypothetical protein
MRMKRPFLVLSFLLAWVALPYLFDVAVCEELYDAPPLQATLTDGETVDSTEGDTLSASLDCVRTSNLRLPSISQGFFGRLSFETCRVSCPNLPISASRAPPAIR